MKIEPRKDLGYYMALPYTIVLRTDEEGDIVSRIEELPGCVAHGANAAKSLVRLREVQSLWIEDCLEAGELVPEPREAVLPSGKWVQRVPRSLHHKLARLAKRENVSLNQLVTSLLSAAVTGTPIAKVPTERFATPGKPQAPRRRRFTAD
jgi:predicted RNase H-like HicB family nuclease